MAPADGTSFEALAMLSGALPHEGNDVVAGPLEPGTHAVTVAGWPGLPDPRASARETLLGLAG